MKIENKIAIVTGASKGIGLETCKLLISKGVRVAGWSRTAPGLEHKNFQFFAVDVSNLKSVENGYAATIKGFGVEVDILINNAGLGYEYPFEETPLDLWQKMFSTNVDGIFYCSRLVIPGMKKKEEGHIINISSIAGTNGIVNMSAYCATKHAVRGLSQSMFKELRNYGIKVTCIYPGSTKTNFFDEISSVKISDNMMIPEDIAGTIIQCLETSGNYHPVDIEVRPLRPKGKQ
jgi:NADP-dependent 3-hydroxy acid dehydrogenase YdfG